ncbi:hypothetical protein Tsubulata_007991 [Turnera subulata]|uniref:RRM domain-containing protein n=1 Tax=Turnera subulata TaxID=218843 RepID=A0A9Q0FLC7_9ROSI|nr:hypothetical protein Tsubulata_007991 [Turnera subulata]
MWDNIPLKFPTVGTLPTYPKSPGLQPPPPPPPLQPIQFPPRYLNHPPNKPKQPKHRIQNPSPSSNTQKPVLFSKWNRKATLSAIESDQLLNVYCENLPISWTTSDILSTLSTYGEIVDIYIPSKKSKSGKRFGFTRFKKGFGQKRILETISTVPVRKGFLRASWAKKKATGADDPQHQKQHPISNNRVVLGKSFAQSIRGPAESKEIRNPLGSSSLLFNPLIETLNWLSSCAFGILSIHAEVSEIFEVFKSHGLNDMVISAMGGNSILVQFQSKEKRDSLLNLLPEWIEELFSLFRAWQPGDDTRNRKCWVQLKGVPLQAWSHEFFSNVSSRFGSLIKLSNCTKDRTNLEFTFLQILTTVRQPISWEVRAEIDGTLSLVSCMEIPDSHIPITVHSAHSLIDLISLAAESPTSNR